jgi:hypothetical protein
MLGVVVPEIVIGEVTEIEVTLEVLTAFKMRP